MRWMFIEDQIREFGRRFRYEAICEQLIEHIKGADIASKDFDRKHLLQHCDGNEHVSG